MANQTHIFTRTLARKRAFHCKLQKEYVWEHRIANKMNFDVSQRAFLLARIWIFKVILSYVNGMCAVCKCICVYELELCGWAHWIFTKAQFLLAHVYVCTSVRVFWNFLVAFARCQAHFRVKVNELRCWNFAPVQRDNANAGAYITQLNENWRRNNMKSISKCFLSYIFV